MRARTRTGNGRLAVGFLIAPALAGGLPLAYCCAGFLAYPYISFMRARGCLSFARVLVPTLLFVPVFAAIGGLALAERLAFEGWLTSFLYLLVMTGPPIILSGISFFFLAVWQRPDRVAVAASDSDVGA